MTDIHPDLAGVARIPNIPWNPVTTRIMQHLKPRPLDPGPGVTVRELVVPGPQDGAHVALRIFQPSGISDDAPALFWIHGGGMIGGSPQQDDRTNIAFARQLGITVAAVRYRLAPQHPAPAAIEDVYAGLIGLFAAADELHIDTRRVAIGGASAGGGLAAALALLVHDRSEVEVAFQLLVYPMIDDRTTLRPAADFTSARVWTARSNAYAWKAYVGAGVGGPDISAYAAPSRRENLEGLPPAWIGVGTIDIFYDEDLEYARRLNAAGVPAEVFTIEGAFHGFDAIFPKAAVSGSFWERQRVALQEALDL